MKKRSEKERALGCMLIQQILKTSGLGKSKGLEPVVRRMSAHGPTTELLGRLARVMRKDNTSELMHETIAHAQALYASGEVDIAKVVREGIKLARKEGVDPTESISKMTGMLDNYKTKLKREVSYQIWPGIISMRRSQHF